MRLRNGRWHAAFGVIVCIAAVAGGCASRPAAVVQERGVPARQPEAPFREVRAGDTLYSIAWESGRDYRELAEWNGIVAPYLIRPGQRLRLHPPPGRAPRAGASAEHYTVRRGDTLYAIARAAGVDYHDLAAWNALRPPYIIVPGQRLRVTPPAPTRAEGSPGRTSVRSRAQFDQADFDDARPIAWRWPTDGAVIARFAPTDGAKGIDIAGKAGQEIRAAASGKVVYQGSGLRGYGQLIIVKHNADFLSAYAHCAAIYVQEGSVIKAGQKIAAMGSSGTDRVKLHFEIRRRGVPVDPLEHLPKK